MQITVMLGDKRAYESILSYFMSFLNYCVGGIIKNE